MKTINIVLFPQNEYVLQKSQLHLEDMLNNDFFHSFIVRYVSTSDYTLSNSVKNVVKTHYIEQHYVANNCKLSKNEVADLNRKIQKPIFLFNMTP